MTTLQSLLSEVLERAAASGVFGSCQIEGDRLVCEADGAAERAFYRVEHEGDRLYVSLVTDNRWLSESIESDLMHSGDELGELLEEELAELAYTGSTPPVEHYRSDDMLFTFRSAAPGDGVWDAGAVAVLLLGYEACFRQLGDMSEESED